MAAVQAAKHRRHFSTAEKTLPGFFQIPPERWVPSDRPRLPLCDCQKEFPAVSDRLSADMLGILFGQTGFAALIESPEVRPSVKVHPMSLKLNPICLMKDESRLLRLV